ncbi:MAG: hypothetical protein A3E82_01900 [Gammaproteobacteria bacterium RIFCSPHIGHO2_12_FULL_38_11]|nr:MAG: hypothetical protein A3E82_01900 [Gammaproteobacteria bacterium RIFCSPHIGHO2_12_FULL_38_11]
MTPKSKAYSYILLKLGKNIMNPRVIEKPGSSEFDTVWDDNSDLKTNIINLMKKDFAKPKKSTGFFTPKPNANETFNFKDDVALSELSRPDITISDYYAMLYSFNLVPLDSLPPMSDDIDETMRKISYIIARLLEAEPALTRLDKALDITTQAAIKNGWPKRSLSSSYLSADQQKYVNETFASFKI